MTINHYVGDGGICRIIAELCIVCSYTDATQSGVIMTSYSFCTP